MKAHSVTSSAIGVDPASASASACPRPISACLGQPAGPMARSRAALQLRRLGTSTLSPAGSRRIRLCTGEGTPPSPPVYWIEIVSAPLAPSRSGENEGAIVAAVACGADAPRAVPEAGARAGTTSTAQIVSTTVKAPPVAIAGRAPVCALCVTAPPSLFRLLI
jgi:hypothetical protein